MQTTIQPTRFETRLLQQALKDATEELQYWRRQAAIRTHPAGIIEAKARVLAWQSTVAARTAALHQSQLP